MRLEWKRIQVEQELTGLNWWCAEVPGGTLVYCQAPNGRHSAMTFCPAALELGALIELPERDPIDAPDPALPLSLQIQRKDKRGTWRKTAAHNLRIGDEIRTRETSRDPWSEPKTVSGHTEDGRVLCSVS